MSTSQLEFPLLSVCFCNCLIDRYYSIFMTAVLYYEGPSYYHATYVVLVSDNADKSNHLDVQSNYRVSEATHKEVVLVNVIRPTGLEYANRVECLQRFNEFKITEILPKRFLINQLSRQHDS